MIRVHIVSTHRADHGHYAPLRALLEKDERFELVDVQPDVAIVLGDRFEMLTAAANWVERRVKLLHLHGGEHTMGSLDERYRYAITMLADQHCVINPRAARELLEVGIDDRRVHVTGAPGLDGIQHRKTIAVEHPFVIVLYNPVIDKETTARESDAIRSAIEGQGWNVLWLGPNGDRYSNVIWEGAAMPHERFRDYLACSEVIVGNSSAGIIEAPPLGTWAVNVGDRQKGRPRAKAVLDVEADDKHIRERIAWAINHGRAPRENPYNSDGRACERIRDVLLSMA